MHRVVLVRPIYSSNVGLVCRVMKNFGFAELCIVGSKKKSKTAYMYAKHSEEVLRNAKTAGTLKEAVRGCDVVIGTTGVLRRFHRKLKTCVPLPQLKDHVHGKAAIVFGSEGVGLTESEVNACDVLVHVPANPEHPVLNLSHAVALVLYALSQIPFTPVHGHASRALRQRVQESWQHVVSHIKSVKDQEKVGAAFRNVLERAHVSDDEARALLTALSRLEKKAGRKKHAA
ncbi:TrmJ/YjtD family RNA methyltransferase [Candidatus Micrarchaeota archaeon]|nr:TrmJ/YjtD family RNA methyltransferase [Candidatus Micrarchaeota archaeon]